MKLRLVDGLESYCDIFKNYGKITIYNFSGRLDKQVSHHGLIATINDPNLETVLKLVYPDDVFDDVYSGTSLKHGVIDNGFFIKHTGALPKYGTSYWR